MKRMDSNISKVNEEKPGRHVISKRIDRIFARLFDIYAFIVRFFKEAFMPPYEGREIVKQCYEVGVKSLPLVSLTGFIIGIVFTNQSRVSLAEFGGTSWLPALISVAIVRALAPLVTAIIAAGKVGSQIGAELGSMKVTEQIDAMEVSATNPFRFLVVTRVLATTFMIPTLMMYMIFIALMGGYVSVHQHELTSFTTYFIQVFNAVTFLDVFSSLIKSFLFGFTIGVVGCYKGYHSSKGTQGVGKAANTSVVMAMFLVFIEELLSLQIITALR